MNPKPINVSELIHDLRQCLLLKIKQEWQEKWAYKHGQHFDTISNLPSQNAFFESLVDDIDIALDAHLGMRCIDYFVSKHTIRRFLLASSSSGFSAKTKTAVALYCGYVDWEQFVKEQYRQGINLDHQKDEMLHHFQNNEKKTAKTELTKSKSKYDMKRLFTWQMGGSFLLILLIGIVLANNPSNSAEKSQSINELFDVIKNANKAELKAYQTLKDEDITALYTHFEGQSSAIKKVQQVVIGSKAKKRTLTNDHNPSAYDILNLSLVELKENEAIIKSHEYWYLKWFDTQTNDYIDYVYKATNTQYYHLVKHKGQWKIRTNAYPLAEPNVAEL